MMVVAESSIASRMPAVRLPSRTRSAVTSAMAPPRKRLRRVWRARLREEMSRSVASTSVLRLDGLERRDAGGDERGIEPGDDAHQEHDPERHRQRAGPEPGEQAGAGEEEVHPVAAGGDAAHDADEPDHPGPDGAADEAEDD